MLPRKYRLSKEEFADVKQSGQLISGDRLAVLVSPRIEAAAGLPRAGMIVSRKISLKATDRNQLKRRLRAALADVLPAIPAPVNIIVLPRKKATEATVDELKEEIKRLLTISSYQSPCAKS